MMPGSNPGLLAILEAKPGKQAALAEFLNTGLALVVRLTPRAVRAAAARKARRAVRRRRARRARNDAPPPD